MTRGLWLIPVGMAALAAWPCEAQSENYCHLLERAGAVGFRPLTGVAEDIVRELGEVAAINSSTIQLFGTRDNADLKIQGAAAQICNGNQRWIFYDKDFVDKIRSANGTDWPNYFTFAHELAHHVNNDPVEYHRNEELEADAAAAVWLTRRGATAEDLVAAVNALVHNEKQVRDYPSRCERIENVIKAYNGVAAEYVAHGGSYPKYVFDRKSCAAKAAGQSLPMPSPKPPVPAATLRSCGSTNGDLLYETSCAECKRLANAIVEGEKSGTIAGLSRVSFYNNCTFKGIGVAAPTPPPGARLGAEDSRECAQTLVQLNNTRLPKATVDRIKGAYEAEYCRVVGAKPETECDRYLREWQNRANYPYRDQLGAMEKYEGALRSTLHTYRCPGF